jgi:hypothetical protein
MDPIQQNLDFIVLPNQEFRHRAARHQTLMQKITMWSAIHQEIEVMELEARQS